MTTPATFDATLARAFEPLPRVRARDRVPARIPGAPLPGHFGYAGARSEWAAAPRSRGTAVPAPEPDTRGGHEGRARARAPRPAVRLVTGRGSEEAMSDFELVLFSVDPDLVRRAVSAGVDSLIADWEPLDKEARQRGAGPGTHRTAAQA